MKVLSVPRFALILLAPLLLVMWLALMPLAGCGGGSSGTPVVPLPTNGNMEVGFVLDTAAPTPGPYNNILFNVTSVRANPAVTPVADNDPNWVNVPVPSGNTSGELQISLNQGLNQVQLFNTAGVPAQMYCQLEVFFDPNNGNVIPDCFGNGAGQSGLEGCVPYLLTFPGSVGGVQTLHFNYPAASATTCNGLNVSNTGNTALVLAFNPGTITGPSPAASPGFSASNAAIRPLSATEQTAFMGTIQGTVTQFQSGTSPPQTVTAELAGTNTVVASAQVLSSCPSSSPFSGSPCYSLSLPATSPNGTAYDLYVSGGFVGGTTGTIVAAKSVVLTPGQTLTQNFAGIAQAKSAAIAGQIQANCPSGLVLPGATVQVLIPPQSQPSPAADFCINNPQQCVSVATAATDEGGNYPLPGTINNPAPFSVLPSLGSGQAYSSYVLQVTAAGYDPLFSPATLGSSNPPPAPLGVCPNPPNTNSNASNNNCNFNLGTGFISGTLDISPAASSPVTALLMAEARGTLNIVGMTTVNFAPGSASAPFTINVPDSGSGIASYDLFATALDLFNGATTPNTGHTIAVLSAVAAPSFCSTTSGAILSDMACAGHSSIFGRVNSFDSGTSVQMSKPDPANTSNFVQLMNSSVGLFGTSNGGSYSFCAPPDGYVLQTYEVTTPASGQPASTPSPRGSPTTAALPDPAPTSSPCPICGTGAPCPGICNGTNVDLSS